MSEKCERFGWQTGPEVCKECRRIQKERGRQVDCNGPNVEASRKEKIPQAPAQTHPPAYMSAEGNILFSCRECPDQPEFPWLCTECFHEQRLEAGLYRLKEKDLYEQRRRKERFIKETTISDKAPAGVEDSSRFVRPISNRRCCPRLVKDQERDIRSAPVQAGEESAPLCPDQPESPPVLCPRFIRLAPPKSEGIKKHKFRL